MSHPVNDQRTAKPLPTDAAMMGLTVEQICALIITPHLWEVVFLRVFQSGSFISFLTNYSADDRLIVAYSPLQDCYQWSRVCEYNPEISQWHSREDHTGTPLSPWSMHRFRGLLFPALEGCTDQTDGSRSGIRMLNDTVWRPSYLDTEPRVD